MKDWIDHIISYDELSREARRELQDAMEKDPAVRATFREWKSLRAAVDARIAGVVSARELLVAYVLEKEGYGDGLSAAEKRQLEEVRSQIEQAVESDSLFRHLVQRIREDAEAFEEVWQESVLDEEEPAGFEVDARRDRPPMRLVSGRSYRWVWRVAAVFVLGAFATMVFLMYQRDAHVETWMTGPGESETIELADGSVVRLYENSLLSYQPADSPARFNWFASVEGRAFFEVAPGDVQFHVETASAVVRVLGTQFAVVADEDETAVTLARGSVSLAPRTQPGLQVTLQPGQRSVVYGANPPTAPETVDLAEELLWTDLFIFRSEPLERIAQRLSRHYNVVIEVPPQLARERVTGTFEQSRPVGEILRTIAATLGVTVRHDGGRRYRFETA